MKQEEKIRLLKIRFDKSKESYEIAEEMSESHPSFSINRYYYSLYYAVTGVLLFTEAEAKTHKGIIVEFNKQLVKTGIFSVEDGRLLTKVFQWRTKGDYDDNQEYSTEDVETIRKPVRELLDKLEDYSLKIAK